MTLELSVLEAWLPFLFTTLRAFRFHAQQQPEAPPPEKKNAALLQNANHAEAIPSQTNLDPIVKKKKRISLTETPSAHPSDDSPPDNKDT